MSQDAQLWYHIIEMEIAENMQFYKSMTINLVFSEKLPIYMENIR